MMVSKENKKDFYNLRRLERCSLMNEGTLSKRLKLKKDLLGDWNNLPPEILVKIFCHCVMTEGHLSIIKLGLVSENWKKIIFTPSLWYFVDFVKGSENFDNKELESITRKLYKYIHHCKKIIFNSSLTYDKFDNLMPYLRNVTEISFKDCPKLKPRILILISDYDRLINLDSLNFDGTFSNRIYEKHVLKFVSDVLPRLKKLNFANNRFESSALDLILDELTQVCFFLEELNLENCFCTNDLDRIPKLQYLRMRRKCLSLKLLNLNHTNFMFHSYNNHERSLEIEKTSKVFDLREFRMNNSHLLLYNQSADILTEFIGDMANLEILELNRLKGNNSFKVIYQYKSQRMKYLYLRESLSGHLVSERELSEQAAKIFRKWASTLIELDLSGNTLYDFSWAVIFKSFPKYTPLVKLNLAKTNVVSAGVEFILRRFKNLRYLNLKLCNHLKEHMKKEYHSIDLKQSRKNLRR